VQREKEMRLELFGGFKYSTVKSEDEEGNEISKKVRTMNRSNGRYSTVHIFSNLLKCGNSGGRVRRKTQKSTKQTHIYWVCRNNDSMGKLVCNHRNKQTEHELLNYVIEKINAYKTNNRHHELHLQYMIEARYETKNLDE